MQLYTFHRIFSVVGSLHWHFPKWWEEKSISSSLERQFFFPFFERKGSDFWSRNFNQFCYSFFRGIFPAQYRGKKFLERLKSNFNFEIWRDAIEIVISELILSGIMRNLEDLELEISQNLLNINQNIYSLYFSNIYYFKK